MKSYLLDTHVWLWLQSTPERVSDDVQHLLVDPANTLLLSVASSWEIAIKYRIGKLRLPEPPATYVPDRMRRSGVTSLPIEQLHALRVADLPDHHDDPFDRLIVVQAQELGIPVVTADEKLSAYSVDIVPT